MPTPCQTIECELGGKTQSNTDRKCSQHQPKPIRPDALEEIGEAFGLFFP